MRLNYVTTYDAKDILNFSGLGYFIANTLEQKNFKLNYVDKLTMQFGIYQRLKKIGYSKLFNKQYSPDRNLQVAKSYSQQIMKRLDGNSDPIFSPGTIPLALLETKNKKIVYTDATFNSLIGFYESFSNLANETKNDGHILEKAALDNVDIAIYSSQWAANSAINYYKINPNKVFVVPFGANIQHSYPYSILKRIITQKSFQTCHLLFIGVDWHRKGGEIAYSVTKKLNELGFLTKLHIVGIKNIPENLNPAFIINHGFLNKNLKNDRELLDKLFLQSHFLILPSKADCTPIVISEANSYGLPCLCSDVGGIPSLIFNESNGKLISRSDGDKGYVDFIIANLTDQKIYFDLCLSAYEIYSTKLSWESCGRELGNIILKSQLL